MSSADGMVSVPVEVTGVLEVTDEALRIADGWYDLHEKHLSMDRRRLWENARPHLRHSKSSKLGPYNHIIGKLATDRPDWIYIPLLKVLYSVEKLNNSKVGGQIRERYKHIPRTLRLETPFITARGSDTLAQSKKTAKKKAAKRLQLRAGNIDSDQQMNQEMDSRATANTNQQKAPEENTDQLETTMVQLTSDWTKNHRRQQELREELHREELAGKKLAMDIAKVARCLGQ